LIFTAEMVEAKFDYKHWCYNSFKLIFVVTDNRERLNKVICSVVIRGVREGTQHRYMLM
jgi:hypothetical protein